jgi:predicted XRE-type DNA-binding protein
MASDCTPSGGNVFADLGLPDPEADRFKANLIHTVADIIRRRDLTQKQAAEILGIDQPKVSNILRGKISGFSTDRLLRFLVKLGYGGSLSVTRQDQAEITVNLSV